VRHPLSITLLIRDTRVGAYDDKVTEQRIRRLQSMTENSAEWVELRNDIALSYMPLLIYVAKKSRWKCLPFEDRVAEGLAGLLRAVAIYNPDYPGPKAKFSTYATWALRNRIRRAAEVYSVVRTPNGAMQKRAVHRKEARLARRCVNEATLATFRDDTTLLLAEFATDYRAPDIPDIIDARDRTEGVRRCVARLRPQYAKILGLRFGIGHEAPMTLQEIGDSLGISKERVRQVEVLAMRQLREMIEKYERRLLAG